MLNTAIIGLGRWGQRLVDSVQDAGRPKGDLIRFTRAVTRTPAKATDFAERHGMQLGSHYAAVLADPAIAAVAIATPHTQHAEQIEAAAAVVRFAFADLGLRRITATHAHDNPRSGRLLRKLGFRETGRRAAWSNSRRQPIEQVRYALSGGRLA